jgi:hypothetical protein
VCDKDVPHDMPESASSCFQLRLYDHKLPTGTFYAGAHRFRFMSPATSDIDADKKSPVSWDRNRWYRFKFQWSQTGAQWYKDGVLQGTLKIPARTSPTATCTSVRLPQGGPGARERHVPQPEDHERRRRDLERQVGGQAAGVRRHGVPVRGPSRPAGSAARPPDATRPPEAVG